MKLPTVDLVITEGVEAQNIVKATLKTCQGLEFRRVILFAPACPKEIEHLVTEFHVKHWNYVAWNEFMLLELSSFIPDGHVLNIHRDGYVLNPHAWQSKFLDYDYIGAPWDYDYGVTVGNGGFSLRSKKFLDHCTGYTHYKSQPSNAWSAEDHFMFRINGQLVIDAGLKIAPPELAAQFSKEGNRKYGYIWNGQFGFHGDAWTETAEASLPQYQ
jgi:hypothetical protein